MDINVSVGDKVQIRNGGIDVTSGVSVLAGKGYGEGGPLWATVDLIDENYNTSGRWGLPLTVVRIRCVSNDGIVVWQVQPQSIASNIIRASDPGLIQITITPIPTGEIVEDNNTQSSTSNNSASQEKTPAAKNPYVTGPESQSWIVGRTTQAVTTGQLSAGQEIETKIISGSDLDSANQYTSNNSGGTWRPLNERESKSIGKASSLLVDGNAIEGGKFQTAWQSSGKRRQMLNDDIENITNSNNFPSKSENSSGLITAKYDYKIEVGDNRYPLMMKLEDKLMEARAALGIPVHGQNDIARSMKYYMYNRFKRPDLNLAYNKSFTHIFFTRPDVNLLDENGGANYQAKNHTEAAMLWRRNPELFKLLTDYRRCKDSNNFNLLLSNQITSFEIQDERLSTIEAGRSWGGYEMIYGDSYSGRTAGEFSCGFNETNDYSVINLIKLWITYIHNVSRGSWLPSYNLSRSSAGIDTSGEHGNPKINSSHVYTKTLDYAASCYVFKCGPDGEDVLYWSKYYGVFPVNTGAGALSWDLGNNVGDTPKLNITFRYSFKRDLSPISLLEFNSVANVSNDDDAKYENSFNVNYAHSSRPYVGAPFVELRFEDPKPLKASGVNTGPNAPNSSIRLKFRTNSDPALTDPVLYRASLANRS